MTHTELGLLQRQMANAKRQCTRGEWSTLEYVFLECFKALIDDLSKVKS